MIKKAIHRIIERHNLPLVESIKLLHPERLVLNFYKGNSRDVGSICYLKRSRISLRHKLDIDLDSLCIARKAKVIQLVNCLVTEYQYGKSRIATQSQNCRHLLAFIDWCDQSGYSDVLDNEELTKVALRAYSEDLKRKLDQGLIKQQTVKSYISPLFKFFERFYNNDDFGKEIKRFKVWKVIPASTKIPQEDYQEKVLAWSKCIFNGFYELIVNERQLPYALPVPGYLKWPENMMWIFPNLRIWCFPPGREKNVKIKFHAFDFKKGKIREINELVDSCNMTLVQAKNSIENANKLLEESNADFQSNFRIRRGALAVNAFVTLFMANTGINFAQVVNLPWNEELQEATLNPSVERQGFRIIKYRANNRMVYFEVGSEFLPSLRKFLQLRNYLLCGKEFGYLFFTLGQFPDKTSLPSQIADYNTQSFYYNLSKFVPDFPSISSRQWRAIKQDFLIRNYDPKTASLLMQHSTTTSLKHYSNGSPVTQVSELRSYLDKVEQIVLSNKQTNSLKPIATGACSAPNKPEKLDLNIPIVPDCKTVEGCLFCDKYRVHVDSLDLKKLLSARYCIRKLSNSSTDANQFDNYFGAVLSKIEAIFDEMRKHDPELFNKVVQDVDIDGELDPFWRAKLELLFELELV